MEVRINIDELSPREIVVELDKYIVGQHDAKKSVALAVRNRVRRRMVPEDMQEEIYPKNIIMIGPTGCGKTEIARRLSRLTGAPFVKVEATKYTEVGYVGRDVESMIRDLVTTSINLVRKEYRGGVEGQARTNTRERILDLLLPSSQPPERAVQNAGPPGGGPQDFLRNLAGMSSAGQQIQVGLSAAPQDAPDISAAAPGSGTDSETAAGEKEDPEQQRKLRARELMSEKLDRGELEDREVEVETQAQTSPMVQVLSGGPNMMEDMDLQVQNMLGDLMPKKSKRRRVTIEEARKIILEEELDRLVDPEKVQTEAIRRAEQMGIVFVDEIDKICGRQMGGGGSGPDVSREGVQRDLLPIVEGATINTRQGPIKTDHILFIAAGAFHTAKPSDLIPELQGRFPIRVELEKLTEAEFRQILTGPKNSLVRQACALLETEKVILTFAEDGLDEIANFAFRVNEETENIGARRLHTIMEKLLEDVSFDAPELPEDQRQITIDRAFVQSRLARIVEDTDTSRYIL